MKTSSERDWTAEFDELAELFYRETGYMAPGKSVPLEMSGDHSDEDRSKVWRAWLKERGEDQED